MLGILNEITLQKELQHSMTINGFWTKTVKYTSAKQKANIKIIVRAGNQTRYMYLCYLLTTETTKRINCSQALELFQHNEWKQKHTKTNLRATLFLQSRFFEIF